MTEQNEISKILFNRLISYKLRAIKAKVNVSNATFNLHEIKTKQNTHAVFSTWINIRTFTLKEPG